MREIFALSIQGFPKTSQSVPKISDDFQNTSKRSQKCPKMLRRRLSTSEAIWKTKIFACFDFAGTQSHHSTPFWNIFLEIEFSLSHVLKKRFVRICESGVRNCPWWVRSMSLFRSREIRVSWVKVGRYINYISSFVFDLLTLQCSWFDSGISIACDSCIKG